MAAEMPRCCLSPARPSVQRARRSSIGAGRLASATLHVRRVKDGTPATHPIIGDELRALRRLQREKEPRSPFAPRSSARRSRLPGSLARSCAPVEPQGCRSRYILTGSATPAASRRRTRAMTHAPCRPNSGTRTSIRGMRRQLNEDERTRLAEAIREHLAGWRIDPGPGIGGHRRLSGRAKRDRCKRGRISCAAAGRAGKRPSRDGPRLAGVRFSSLAYRLIVAPVQANPCVQHYVRELCSLRVHADVGSRLWFAQSREEELKWQMQLGLFSLLPELTTTIIRVTGTLS